MPIVDCPACGARMKLTDEQAIKQVRCPRCKGVFVPEVIPVAPLVRPGDPPPRRSTLPPAKPPSSIQQVIVVDDDDEVLETEIPERVPNHERRGMVARTKVALILTFVGLCLTFASVVLACLFVILLWAQAGPTEHRVEIVGIPGLLGWLVSAVGVGFAVSGVRRQGALGLSIALASVAALHLLFMTIFILADPPSIRNWGEHDFGMPRTNPSIPSTRMPFRYGAPKPLQNFDTALPYAYTCFGVFAEKVDRYAQAANSVAYHGMTRYGFLPTVAGLLEVARWILLALWLRAVARVSRSYDQENAAMTLMVCVAIMVGILFVLNLILSLLPTPTTQSGANALFHSLFAVQLLGLIGVVGITVFAGVVTHTLWRQASDRGEARPAKRR